MKKIVIGLVLAVTIALGTLVGMPFIKYNGAINELENGEYEKAKATFVELEDFKDSTDLVGECDYQKALSFKDQGNYAKTVEVLETIADYKDSAAQITESKYLEAKSYMEAKNYEAALVSLEDLGAYKDSNEIIKECKYSQGLLLVEKKEYDDAITYFKEIEGYKDTDAQLKEAQYKNGVKYYNTGSFSTACNILSNLKGYKDSDELLKRSKHMTSYIGTWKPDHDLSEVVISGWDVTSVFHINGKNSSQATFDFELLDDGSLDTGYDRYKLNKSGDVLTEIGESRTVTYTKSSSVAHVPEERVRPSIGMTKAQLKESSWGEPKDINKTTTKHGVKEQWCYSGYRYVYLEDEIVTSIQE